MIPVLLDRTRMPTEAELPASLAKLTYRNAIEVDQGRDFHHHVDRLIQGIAFQFERPITTGAHAHKPEQLPQQTIASVFEFALKDTGLIESGSLSERSNAPPVLHDTAASTRNTVAPRKRYDIPTSLPYAAALLSMAFMGIIIYFVAFNGTVQSTRTNKKDEPQPRREWRIGMKLVRIEAGEFWMGTTPEQVNQLMQLFPYSKWEYFDVEQPRHRVKISRPFYLGIHEVTVGQFKRFVELSGYQTEAEKSGMGSDIWDEPTKAFRRVPSMNWRNPGFAQTDDHPVVCVSRNDALEFCEWLCQQEGRSYRLPTEAEWEFACRAGATSLFLESDDPESLAKFANLADATLKRKCPEKPCIKGDDGYPFTAPVGSFAPNRLGLYDMIGNVSEWCADWYDDKYYASSPPADPPGGRESSDRVFRGGCWDNLPGDCRPAFRRCNVPVYRCNFLGFRVAVDRE